jgi:hypothetical protein
MPDLRSLIGLTVRFRDDDRVCAGEVVGVQPWLEHVRAFEDRAAARQGDRPPTGAEVLARYGGTEDFDPFADMLIVSVHRLGWPGDGVEMVVHPLLVEAVRVNGEWLRREGG